MNEPAFPNEGFNGWGEPFQGMTLRDYFAAKAMQAILPTYNNVFDDDTGGDDDPTFPELLAKDAYIMADAMLKAREAHD
jgi:hypothetical protein